MRVNGNLNVLGLIKNLKIEQLETDPATPAVGRMWFNVAEGALKYYDGNVVQNVASGGGNLQDFLRTDGSSTMTGDLLLNGTDQSESAEAAAVSKGHVTSLLDTKQNTITGAASTVTTDALESNRGVVTNAQGKIAATTSATAAEIEYLVGTTANIQEQLDGKGSALGYDPVNKAGDAMTGNLLMGGNTIGGLGAPVNANDATRKVDLDNALAGLDFQADVLALQEDAVLDPGESPVSGARYIIGAPESLNANFGTIENVEANDIVEYNGEAFVVAFDVSTRGQGVLAWNQEIANYQYFDGNRWRDFGGLTGFSAGVGLRKDPNTQEVSVELGAGIGQLPTNEVGIDLRTEGGLMLSEDGVTPSTGTAAKLHAHTDNTTVETSPNGLRLKASGVNAQHINAQAIGTGLAGGDGNAIALRLASESSGLSVDENGLTVDRAALAGTFLNRDGSQAMTGQLLLHSSDQSESPNEAAVSKGHLDGTLASVNQSVSDVTTRLQQGHFVYDGTAEAAASHTVTHNMGTKYVQVIVVDENDDVILPESITFADANSLIVTFTQSEACRIVVTGLKAVA